jgi:Na+-transporting methylmalonyl-CoA/oxaloacetate decarboxylase gamma subunit
MIRLVLFLSVLLLHISVMGAQVQKRKNTSEQNTRQNHAAAERNSSGQRVKKIAAAQAIPAPVKKEINKLPKAPLKKQKQGKAAKVV